MNRLGRPTLAAAAATLLFSLGTACAEVPARVSNSLERALGPSGARATVRERPGPLGTTVVQAVVPGAYPGTGVATVIVDRGRSYGAHGEADLAELVRRRGWLTHPPAYADYRLLVDDALFDGLAGFDDTLPHSLAQKDGALELRVTRRMMPSNSLEWVVVRVGPRGKAVVERTFAGSGVKGASGDRVSGTAPPDTDKR